MEAKQVTTYALNRKPVTETTILPITLEADEYRHLESGVLDIYPEIEYQEIEGFGGALTESVGYLYSTLTDEYKRKFLEDYFGENGQHYRFIRMHIDSCDYSLEEYQAVEDPMVDPDFTTFTIERDRKYMIPMLKEAMKMTVVPFSIVLSPWSPPKQWKNPPTRPKNDASVYGNMWAAFMPEIDYEHSSRCNGGTLKKEHYQDWANYLARYVQAYLDEEIPVTMMTIQNETIAATCWDSCTWTAEAQKEFLRDYLYPTFEKTGLAGKIGLYIWDHNKERIYEFSKTVIDEQTSHMLEGIAFHWYSGDHFEALGITHEQFPDMKLMSSECCALHPPGKGDMFAELTGSGKTVAEVDYKDASDYAHDIIGNLNHGMNRWIDWNLCLDENGGPRRVPQGFGSPVCVNKDGTYTKLLTFDYIGHFSKYILPGAKRIGVSRCNDLIDVTAVKNQDGSIAVVLLNRGNADTTYAIRIEGKIIRTIIPAKTISTICF